MNFGLFSIGQRHRCCAYLIPALTCQPGHLAKVFARVGSCCTLFSASVPSHRIAGRSEKLGRFATEKVTAGRGQLLPSTQQTAETIAQSRLSLDSSPTKRYCTQFENADCACDHVFLASLIKAQPRKQRQEHNIQICVVCVCWWKTPAYISMCICSCLCVFRCSFGLLLLYAFCTSRSVYLSIDRSIYLPIFLFIHGHIYQTIRLCILAI